MVIIKIKVAILDDYQNVTHHFANWKKLSEKIELKIFNEYIGDVPNLSEKLSDFHVLCFDFTLTTPREPQCPVLVVVCFD